MALNPTLIAMNQAKLSLAGLTIGLLASAASAQGSSSFTTIGIGGPGTDWALDGGTVLIGDFSAPYIVVVSDGSIISIDPGGDSVVALSDSGQVLGQTPDLVLPADTSGLWIPGAWTSMGAVGLTGCPDLSNSYDLSDDGMVATGLGWDGCSAFAYKWTLGVGMVQLPQLGPNSSRGNVVSGDGSTIGGWDEGTTGARRAAIWMPDGTEILPLETPTYNGAGETWGFSTNGEWACGSGNNTTGPFVWNAATGPIFLGFPAPLGSFDVSQANAVSDDGKVVVGFQGSAFGTPPRSWIWTASGGIALARYLPDLPRRDPSRRCEPLQRG